MTSEEEQEVIACVAALVRTTAPDGWQKHMESDGSVGECVPRETIVYIAMRLKKLVRRKP